MTLDLSLIPTVLDAGHAGLAGLSVVLLALYLGKKGKTIEVEKTVEVEKIVETPVEKIVEVEKVVEVEKIIEKIVEIEPQVKATSPDSALQLIALLQQEARFVDFAQEDLSGFQDAEIGAAARVIHEGSQKVLKEYFSLSPIRTEDEESRITLQEGFDSQAIRLTGNVVGSAPFTGTLLHRGWKVDNVSLPKISDSHNTHVVAPAEVEL